MRGARNGMARYILHGVLAGGPLGCPAEMGAFSPQSPIAGQKKSGGTAGNLIGPDHLWPAKNTFLEERHLGAKDLAINNFSYFFICHPLLHRKPFGSVHQSKH